MDGSLHFYVIILKCKARRSLRLTDLPPVLISVSVLVLRTLAEMAAATSVHVLAIIEPIIQHADWFFPEGETLLLYLQ